MENLNINQDIPMDTLGEEDDGVEKVVKERFEDLETEAKRLEAQRCTTCRRMTSGHEGPYGSKCNLKNLSEEELKHDDLEKLKAKEMKKNDKRKGEHEYYYETAQKKKSEEKAEQDRLNRVNKENEKLQKKIDEKREERIRMERENTKLEKMFDEDNKKAAQEYKRWRGNQDPGRRLENDKGSKRMENRCPSRN